MPDDALISSLRAAVQAAPDDAPLRLHLGELLLAGGRPAEAITEAATVLQRDPASTAAHALLARAGAGLRPGASAGSEPTTTSAAAADSERSEAIAQHPSSLPPATASEPTDGPGLTDGQHPGDGHQAISGHESVDEPGARPPAFDWAAAENEVRDVVPPRFVKPELATTGEDDPAGDPLSSAVGDVEQAGITLGDVAGMQQVKERLNISFLMPMRNPELRRLYGKSLRGGLMLYGPPGCGKTFIARAVAGELGARFYPVALTDVLDPCIGMSERKLHAVFETARRNAPCVLFLDEVDAIGFKRSDSRGSGLRTVVQSLLAELDGAEENNEGVFVLAATNAPWDVDSALKRPGRLDRMLLVLPPDAAAREAVLRLHLRERPIEKVDVTRLAARTEGWSGADLAHVCESAAERAMADSVRSGEVRSIRQADLEQAIREIRPSTGAWLELARNVVLFANESGVYDDLLAYLKQRKLV